MDFCTVADIRQMLSVKTAGTIDAGLLEKLAKGVTVAMQNVISRTILSASYIEVRKGTGTSTLVLKNTPVTAVASVAIGPPSGRTTLTVDVEYVWSETSIQLLGGIFTQRSAWVVVEYTAGYTEVPADLNTAAAKTAALRYREFERLGQASNTFGGQTITFDNKDFPADVMTVLTQYQRKAPIF